MASHFAPDSKGTPSRTRGGDARDSAARRVVARRVGIVLGVVLAVLVVAGGTSAFMLYRSATSVRAQASEIMAQVDPMKEALKSGDAAALDDSVGIVQENMAQINAEVQSPLWTLASFVPVVGEDVRSVQALGDAGSALVNDALVPIANSLSGTGLSDLIQNGVVNVELVRAVGAAVGGSVPTIKSAVETISSLPEAHVPQLREVLERVQGPVGEMSGLVDQLGPVLDALPAMLGGDGARTYLIVAQNNSELRATGGLPGSWGTITVADGVISMGGDFETILHQPDLSVQITPEEADAIATNMDTDPAQVNCTPDFTRVGELARAYWAEVGNGDVDGVVALDPVFLQWLLGLTGGFTAPDGTTVDGSNAAQVLLSDTYWKFGNDGAAQDAYFTSVASAAFDQIMSNLGNAGMTDLLDVIKRGGESGRLLVWMADEGEQSVIEGMGLSGELETDPATPVLGVYLNDDTYSKISWYASCSTTVGEGVENPDGTTTYDVTTTLTNTITPEVARSAPLYIYGGSGDKRDNSDMIDYVFFFAPAGGTITNLSTNDGAVFDGYGFYRSSLSGLEVYRTRTHLLAGESAVFTYQVTVPAEAEAPLAVRTTPLAREELMQAPAA